MRPGGTIVEGTAGNTALVCYAFVFLYCRLEGYMLLHISNRSSAVHRNWFGTPMQCYWLSMCDFYARHAIPGSSTSLGYDFFVAECIV